MIETVLDVYLASLPNERAFDAPFLALLPTLGFFDVRYTHGSGEFGKDFIAKKDENGEIVQYSFQVKRHVAQSEWRDVQSQILDAVISPCTHPHFDATLPHQPVLVVTDRLSNNSAIGGSNLNQQLQLLQVRPLQVWERPQLVNLLAVHGLNAVHRATATGFREYGRFYSLYGEAIEARLSPRSIENYSRNWLCIPQIDIWPPTREALSAAPAPTNQEITSRLLVASLESSILFARCHEAGLRYEAFICHLSAWRAVLHAWHEAVEREEGNLATHCSTLHLLIRQRVKEAAWDFINWVEHRWRLVNRQLVLRVADLEQVPAQVLSYPVHCARIVETMGLVYFLEEGPRCGDLAALIEEFVSQEPGCSHPVGDYYAVSYAGPLLVLGLSGRMASASNWWRTLALWLLDRYEQGSGLARLEATPQQEAQILFGHAFECFSNELTSGSFLATVLADWAIWSNNASDYEDFIADLQMLSIYPQYVQPPNSEGLFRFEAPDVNQLARVTYEEQFSPFIKYHFASHISLDRSEYVLSSQVDFSVFVGLSILLRDRTFPRLWPTL